VAITHIIQVVYLYPFVVLLLNMRIFQPLLWNDVQVFL